MLADNGQYTASAVAAMSVAEIERAYDDPCFEPQYAFYTEVDGNGLPQRCVYAMRRLGFENTG